MAGWHRIGLRFRQPRAEEGNALGVVPPLGLMLFIPLAAAWLAVTLVYSVGAELTVARQVGLALFGGLAPMGITYGLVTNRRWTRLAILLTLAGNIWLYGVSPGVPLMAQLGSNLALGFLTAVWAAVALYLYGSRSCRAYYLLIAGAVLSDELQDVDLSPPPFIAAAMDNLAGISEWVLIILAFAVFFSVLFGLPTSVSRW
jgi:hypothetical protein